MILGQCKYAHVENIEQLFNNLYYDMSKNLTLDQKYMILSQYNHLKIRERLDNQEQMKEIKKQVDDIVINELQNLLK